MPVTFRESFHFWYSILTKDPNVFRDLLAGRYHPEFSTRIAALNRNIYPRMRNEDLSLETYFGRLYEMVYPSSGNESMRPFNYHRYVAWYKRVSELKEIYTRDVCACFRNRFFVVIQSFFHRKLSTWIPKPAVSERGGTFFFGTVHKTLKISDFNLRLIPNLCFFEMINSLQEVEHTHFMLGTSYPRK
jgi:hypothetical protein